ncbi:alpha-N-acetylglucosaminidase [Companilactobacillus farciminis]|uniref:alpha-N-acetylglucosaminidase n=1 Tax=Companilactobacillus farciminis TaxID=1612 RepID=UPI0019152B0C|nr:alpha-N-acetylglucosaminidase TIM-barrel domain-containing protein [Companilactobacillus farciminis]
MSLSEKEISSHLEKSINYVDNENLIVEIPTETLSPITKIIVEFNSTNEKTIDQFTLQHAFNHVMSDLVLDKQESNVDITKPFTFKFKTPKSASHILINAKSKSKLKSLIQKLRIFVTDTDDVTTVDNSIHEDWDSISYDKSVLTTSNERHSNLITDGSLKTIWQGDSYPSTIDIDLQNEYRLKESILYFPKDQEVIFDLYGSNNGLDYSFISHNDVIVNDDTGISIVIDEKNTYSFIRVTILYNSGSESVQIKQIRLFGDLIGNRESVKPFKFLTHKDFKNLPLSTDKALYGIVSRNLGKQYCDWFKFDVNPSEKNCFTLENCEGKIKITGSSGVNIAAGLNYYLKYYCNVNISQKGMGKKINLPKQPILLDSPISKVSRAKYVYSYNYTTFSYTMPFWDESDWQSELDWSALNGVNLVLDPIGQEAVWSLFLRRLGYSDMEIQRQVSFSTFSAWQWMGNISGVGGPVSLEWINNRTKLAYQNHRFMKALGMTPIIRGYGGLLPESIRNKEYGSNAIKQGQWCSFPRPDMIKTNSSDYKYLSKLFYVTQENVLGEISHFYSVDPFHEGGILGDMTKNDVSANLMKNLLDFDSKAIWVIQSWQENPTPELLKGIENYKKSHALVLDLYAERNPQWTITESNSHGGKEFSNTPWLFCLLNNFGGRMGLSGHFNDLWKSYKKMLDESNYCLGIGITPEASLNNPIIYDYFFELTWKDNITNDLDFWIKKYSLRRYGESKHAFKSLKLQLNTVYNSHYNTLGQGAPESIINSRPSLNISAASTWGNSVIEYSKSELIESFKELLIDYDNLKNSTGYQFDLVTLGMQVLSNFAQDSLEHIKKDMKKNDLPTFLEDKESFMRIVNLVDEIASKIPIYRLQTWERQAARSISNCDDFTKIQSIIDARSLITTWGSLKQANSGGLHDYSNRQWSGLTRELYKTRWSKWFDESENKIRNMHYNSLDDNFWFNLEWKWVISNSNNKESVISRRDLKDISQNILEVAEHE